MIIAETAQIGKNVDIGNDVHIGHFTVIHDNVTIMDKVVIGSHAIIKPHTVLGQGVFFDDYCVSSGHCQIGDFSQIRYQSIIARNVFIGRHVFYCAGVKTAYLNHMAKPNPKQLIVNDRVFVGDNSTILSGLTVSYGVVIGAHSLLTKDAIHTDGIYVGTPAKFTREMNMDEKAIRSDRMTTYVMRKEGV